MLNIWSNGDYDVAVSHGENEKCNDFSGNLNAEHYMTIRIEEAVKSAIYSFSKRDSKGFTKACNIMKGEPQE